MSYITIRDFGEDKFIEKKSEFIGYAKRCESEEEAKAFVQEIKNLHVGASQLCYIIEKICLFRDIAMMGNSGNSRIPILEVIKAI